MAPRQFTPEQAAERKRKRSRLSQEARRRAEANLRALHAEDYRTLFLDHKRALENDPRYRL